MSKKKLTEAAVIVAALVIIASCHSYYRVNKGNTKDYQAMQAMKDTRFFILRNGDDAFAMLNFRLSDDKRTATCDLTLLPSDHLLHVNNGDKGERKFAKKNANESAVTNEVHFYIPRDNNATVGNYTLSLDKIFKIEVLEFDKKRTTNSYVIGTIGTVLGSIVVVAIIIAATKSSCPFVSAYDGNNFSLQGEIYGGAIYPQLARKDYLPLKMTATNDGSYQLKISNELKEIQYTDHTRLWKIGHPENSRVFVDQQGNLHCISLPQSPIAATVDNTHDVLPALLTAGDMKEATLDDSSREDGINELHLKFKRPANAKKGKLLLSLRNSYWLDLLYGELAKGFGTYYATYATQQRKKPASELLKWVNEQALPLSIEINCGEGWKKLTQLNTIGPLAFRETGISFDLPYMKSDEIAIRMVSGFMFWEFDYAAMDFSEDIPFSLEKIKASSAFDETGKDILASISSEDGIYLAQPEIGNCATISFHSEEKENAGQQYSFVLETKGYYEHLRDFNTKPNPSFLAQFRVPGGFPKFGRQLFAQVKAAAIKDLASTSK